MKLEKIALRQNYPNPFNSKYSDTQIDYILRIDGHATLRIYDILGREAVKLVDDPQIAGRHSIKWNGQMVNGIPVASGIYIVNLKCTNNG